MIDFNTEELLSFAQATKEVPTRPAIGTVNRWGDKGVRGVRLETILIGGLRYTSKEALRRFFERITAAADGEPPPERTTSQRAKDIARAEKELADAGI